MGFLAECASVPAKRPPVFTIFGDAGMGKTTLSLTFPKPIIVRAEDGAPEFPEGVLPLPVLTKGDEIWKQLQAVLMEEHDYRTLVIDSVSALDRLFIEDIVDDENKTRYEKDGANAKPASISSVAGGYGRGYELLTARHARVKRACDLINSRKNMNIVFLSHADIEQIDTPDQDPFMRWNLRLAKKSAPIYVDGADVVGFIRLQAVVKASDDKGALRPKAGKIRGTGNRQLIVHATPANVSKNRYGITDPLPFTPDVNPFASIIAQ